MMTEEEKKKAIEEQQLADLHHFRRLIVGCPVYGSFQKLEKLRKAVLAPSLPVSSVQYTCGYFNPQTGGFSPYPS